MRLFTKPRRPICVAPASADLQQLETKRSAWFSRCVGIVGKREVEFHRGGLWSNFGVARHPLGSQSASMSEFGIRHSSRIFRNLRKLYRLRADSNFRAQSGEPYLDAPLRGPHEPRQSALGKAVPSGTTLRWEIRQR